MLNKEYHKYGILITTNFQLLSLLKIVLSSKSEFEDIILFLSKNIVLCYEKKKKILEIEKIKKIYLVNEYEQGLKNKKFVKTLIDTINKKSFLNYVDCNIEYFFEYSIVPHNSMINSMFLHCFKHSKLQYIDDGLGSYYKNVDNLNCNSFRRFIQRITLQAPTAEKIYLNCPELVQYKSYYDVLYIPFDDNYEINNKLHDVFCINTYKKYKAKSIIYLSQPFSELDVGDYKDIENSIFDIISPKYKDAVYLRKHPSEKNKYFDKGQIELDVNEGMWELLCPIVLDDSNILISFCSAAQFTPKMMCQKEPFIIFLFELYDTNYNTKADCQKSVDMLIKSYKAKNKIFIPKSLNELSKVLECIKEMQGE